MQLPSGLLLTLMTTHLFHFRFADTEQYRLVILTFFTIWDQKLSHCLHACAHQQCFSEHVAPMPFMQQRIWILHTVFSILYISAVSKDVVVSFQQQCVRSSEFAVDSAE